MKDVLYDLFGIKAHSYQGWESNYLAPDIRKVLRDIHKLVPMMHDDSARAVYMDVLLALRKVNNRIFGLQLDPNWSSLISDL